MLKREEVCPHHLGNSWGTCDLQLHTSASTFDISIIILTVSVGLQVKEISGYTPPGGDQTEERPDDRSAP